MQHTHYLIVGASHAALSAMHAIRMHDREGAITVASRDDCLPYSPTVLPYVVSGRSDPRRVFLRDDGYFHEHRIDFLRGKAVTTVVAERNLVRFDKGEEMAYRKLLLATGAAPALPPIPGLGEVPFHVLRTLDDALRLKDELSRTRQAVVLGAGLVGMHAAENLAKAGAQVTVVEMQPQVLPGYFDREAAGLIEKAFAARGICVLTGDKVIGLAPLDRGCLVTLASGNRLPAELLLVSTGVTPVMDYLKGSGVETDRGILVDDRMRTSVANIWAAGDVVQARGFLDAAKIINGILPDAVEQGKIAGMAMADDPALKAYPGGVPLNTYTFFGQQAISVGAGASGPDGLEAVKNVDLERNRYLKIVMQENRLRGIFGINVLFDPGIMWELILRRTDLGPVKEKFLAWPQQTARILMSKTWR